MRNQSIKIGTIAIVAVFAAALIFAGVANSQVFAGGHKHHKQSGDNNKQSNKAKISQSINQYQENNQKSKIENSGFGEVKNSGNNKNEQSQSNSGSNNAGISQSNNND